MRMRVLMPSKRVPNLGTDPCTPTLHVYVYVYMYVCVYVCTYETDLGYLCVEGAARGIRALELAPCHEERRVQNAGHAQHRRVGEQGEVAEEAQRQQDGSGHGGEEVVALSYPVFRVSRFSLRVSGFGSCNLVWCFALVLPSRLVPPPAALPCRAVTPAPAVRTSTGGAAPAGAGTRPWAWPRTPGSDAPRTIPHWESRCAEGVVEKWPGS